MAVRAARDPRLIDALEQHPRVPFQGRVWRIVREGRDPRQCSASGGRWDDGTFEVLYTSSDRNGAIAEMHFHLSRGQPVFPSRVRYTLHELHISLTASLSLETLDDLGSLGVDTRRFGQLSYAERQQEYPPLQAIAEIAHFLDCDGVVVPCARWPCTNVVPLCDRLAPAAIETIADHGLVDWVAWQKENRPDR